MPPKKRPQCQVCKAQESKYTCSKCMVLYCSVLCYKHHKESGCSPVADVAGPSNATPLIDPAQSNTSFYPPGKEASKVKPPEDPPKEPYTESEAPGSQLRSPSPPLRPLTSLNWPYVEEESAYPDPLKRDDPKPLQLRQYEAIATSPTVRNVLATHPQLRDVLYSIDQLRGEDRNDALQRALGVSTSDLHAHSRPGSARNVTQPQEDTRALRELAEAIEAAVRGGKEDALGLDWGD